MAGGQPVSACGGFNPTYVGSQPVVFSHILLSGIRELR